MNPTQRPSTTAWGACVVGFVGLHPHHSNGNSHMALGDRRSETTTAGSALGCARGRHPRLGLAVRCGDLALSLFCVYFTIFFTCTLQPKHQNGAIFVNTEGTRPCLGKPRYGAPQWALGVRLIQKERLKPTHKSPIYVACNLPFLVILVIFCWHTCHYGHFA